MEEEGLGRGFEEIESEARGGTGEVGGFESGSGLVESAEAAAGGSGSGERERDGGGALSSCKGGERR